MDVAFRRRVTNATVLAGLDIVRGETVENLIPVLALAVKPLAHVLKHEGLDLGLAVDKVRVEETLENLVDELVGVGVGVAPGLDNALDRELDDNLGNLPGGLVEDKTKVVLGEERVGGVRRVPVVPDLVLVDSVDDGLRRRAEGRGGRAEEGLDKGLEGGHDKDGNRVADLVNERAKAGNLLEGVLIGKHDIQGRKHTSILFMTESRKLRIFHMTAWSSWGLIVLGSWLLARIVLMSSISRESS